MRIQKTNWRAILVMALAFSIAPIIRADLVGPYTPDANTLFLFHFDEAAGGSVAANQGSKGGNLYAVDESVATTTPSAVFTMLGAAGYLNGATNFHSCMTNPTTGYVFGYDANNSGAYQGDGGGSSLSADALAMTNLNIGFNGQSPFTIEALIQPTTISGVNQEIISTDSSASSRAFQFRITSGGQLNFQFINGSKAISGTIPATGDDRFVAGNWYHVAVTYDGTTATLYWTLLNPTNGAAHVLSTAALAIGTTQGATTGPLCVGNENRNVAGEMFLGSIDEVRISSVARGSGQMQFYSPRVTITQNPVSQNVDYNQPVTFSVAASSQFSMGYQWRFNSSPIPGLTNSSFTITNVAASHAGSYDCVVTNTAGFTATSSAASLVVGAANFLANRYSFTIDTSDSVGGQWGTNNGNATVSGGKLVLDGTTDTFMELPGNLFNGGNATALTVEFWATFGSNPNNVYAFAFGVTNFVIGSGIVGFNHAMYSPHNPSGQTASATPGDPMFAQTVSAPGNFDDQTVHIAVVFDPPNKLFSIYTNGVLEAVNTNFTVNISSLNDQLSYIGKSLWASDPFLNASIDEIRIFKGALSPITIKQSQDQGPDTLLADGPAEFVLHPANTSVPVGQTATFTAAAVGYLPITYQWFKDGSLIAGATNASYSLVGALADNNSTFIVYATNTIGVTTYVTSSSTATLTVFMPPTLAWLDAANGGADSDWNTTSLNWTDTVAGGVIAFSQTNAVRFDNRGAGSPYVNVTQPTVVYKVTADSTADYVLSSAAGNGSLVGQGSITKLNSGRLTIDLTNNLSGPTVISGGTLQVGNYDSLGSLGGGQVTNNATLSFSRADTALNVGNSIHGTGTVSFDGGGTVAISGVNDYTGPTLVNAGIVNLLSSSGLGAATGNTTVGYGAQVYITANVDVPENFVLYGSGPDATSGALRKGGAGFTAITGTVNFPADATIGLDNGATLVLSNTVSGAGPLTVTGGGNLTLAKPNTYNGGTTISAGVVNVNANAGLGTAPATISGTGRFVLGDGVSVANAFVLDSVSPGVGLGSIMVNDNTNGTVTTVSGSVTASVAPANGGMFLGPFSSGYLNVTGPVNNTTTGDVSSRDGFVRFSGGGSYTLFDLKQGTVSIGANNGLSTGASIKVASIGGATFDLNGFNQALTGLADGGVSASEVITNSAASTSTLTLNLSAPNTFSGVIAGKVALVQNGTGSLLLAGTNSYTGDTTINAGTLELAQPSLAAVSTVRIASGAFLQLDFTTTNRVAGLVLNGVSQPFGVYNSTTSPSYITGPGSLEVAAAIASNPTNITFNVSGGNVTISWPASHLGWILQSQTNALSAGLGTNWTDVAGSDSATQKVIAISPANPSVFYRLRRP